MAAGPGDLPPGRKEDKDAKKEKEKASTFSWPDEFNRVQRIWGAPSTTEPLPPVRRVAVMHTLYSLPRWHLIALELTELQLNLNDITTEGMGT